MHRFDHGKVVWTVDVGGRGLDLCLHSEPSLTQLLIMQLMLEQFNFRMAQWLGYSSTK